MRGVTIYLETAYLSRAAFSIPGIYWYSGCFCLYCSKFCCVILYFVISKMFLVSFIHDLVILFQKYSKWCILKFLIWFCIIELRNITLSYGFQYFQKALQESYSSSKKCSTSSLNMIIECICRLSNKGEAAISLVSFLWNKVEYSEY